MKLTRQRFAVWSAARLACASLYIGAQAKSLFTDIAADRRTPSVDLL